MDAMLCLRFLLLVSLVSLTWICAAWTPSACTPQENAVTVGRCGKRGTGLSPVDMVSCTVAPSPVSNGTDTMFASRFWHTDTMSKRTGTRRGAKKKTTKTSARNSAYTTEGWNTKFEELRAYKERHGDCHVPQLTSGTGTLRDKALADWVRNQRFQYKSGMPYLTPERIEKLKSLGFKWNMHTANWHLRFRELEEFRKRHGHSNVPSTYSDNLALARWVSVQRRRYKELRARETDNDLTMTTKKPCGKSLTNEQVELLNSIGFSWTPKCDLWWNMYRQLQEFQSLHGHCRVPQQYNTNPQLGAWVRHQRHRCREYVHSVQHHGTTSGVHVSGINEERLKALSEIGFCWLPDPSNPEDQPPADIFEGY